MSTITTQKSPASQKPNPQTHQKIIHIIPAKPTPADHAKAHKKLRVAAYARVSTTHEEQQNSLENQIIHYETLVKSHKHWRLVQIYQDEGLSGLRTAKRHGFNQMLRDAEAGRIDLIVTKSISRFARNMLDAITTIRHLKALGVDIFFEKENLHTADEKSEFFLTILSSMAQEESRSISENITWGLRQNMARGKVVFHYKNFLGYERGPRGTPKINREEAKIVRRIFRQFLSGYSIREIGRGLERDGIPTPAGKTTWPPSTIASILRNEKYKGDALLQKVYTVDFLTRTLTKNTGQHPQYYIEHSHPAIISATTYEQAQAELKRRAGSYNKHKIANYHQNSAQKTPKVCYNKYK